MLSPTGGPPAARSGQSAVFDSANRRMTIFGGVDPSGALNDSWSLYAPGISGLGCSFEGGSNLVNAEGIAEPVGDVLLYCIGGTPTPQGEPIPEYTVSLKLNTNITTRLLAQGGGLSEATLLIDDPFPGAPVPSNLTPAPSQPPQILCAPLGSTCEEKGTGGTPSPYQTQPNVFVGKQSGAQVLQWKVPIDPPGVNQYRSIRMKNIRANVSEIYSASQSYTVQVQPTMEIEGSQPVPVGGFYSIALGQPGIQASGVLSPVSIPQCEPHNAALLGGSGTTMSDFKIGFSGFANIFLDRDFGSNLLGPTFPPTLIEQNVLNYPYYTETGFYSPSLFTSALTIGLADSGTRFRILFSPVSAGTHLFLPTTIYGDFSGPQPIVQLQLIQADSNGKSAPGYEPVEATASDGAKLAEATRSGSSAYAIYEVVLAQPGASASLLIPVWAAFTNTPATGPVSETLSLAPLGVVTTANETAPIPRFANFASPQLAYSITSCSAQAAGK